MKTPQPVRIAATTAWVFSAAIVACSQHARQPAVGKDAPKAQADAAQTDAPTDDVAPSKVFPSAFDAIADQPAADLPQCATSSDCQGMAPACQIWNCNSGHCVAVQAPKGTACEDGKLCTVGDACSSDGYCAGTPKNCDDGNGCTKDACAPKDGTCYGVAVPGPCDDGDACTVDSLCAGELCKGGSGLNCDDGNNCTADSCGPKSGCTHKPAAGQCSNACFPKAVCADGVCLAGAATNCDDGNACTDDACDAATGCIHADSPIPCASGICSTGICQAGACTSAAKLWTADLPALDNWASDWHLATNAAGRTTLYAVQDSNQGGSHGAIVDRFGATVASWPKPCTWVLDSGANPATCLTELGGQTAADGVAVNVKVSSVSDDKWAAPKAVWKLVAQNGAAWVGAYPVAASQTSSGVWLTAWAVTDAPPIEEGYCPWTDPACGKFNGVWLRSSDDKVATVLPFKAGQVAFAPIGGAATPDKGLLLAVTWSSQVELRRVSAGGSLVWSASTKIYDDPGSQLVLLKSGVAGVINLGGESTWFSADGAVIGQNLLLGSLDAAKKSLAAAPTVDGGFVVLAQLSVALGPTLLHFAADRSLQWQRPLAAAVMAVPKLLGPLDDGFVAFGFGTYSALGEGTLRLVRFDAFGHPTCGSAGLCAGKTVTDCDDGKACTNAACDPPVGCSADDNNGSCSDAACTGNQACASGKCGGGAALNCSDNNPCTLDGCQAGTGKCTHTGLADGTPCGAKYVCAGGQCKL